MTKRTALLAAAVLGAALAGCGEAEAPGDGVRPPRPTTTLVPPAPTPRFALTNRTAPDPDTARRPAVSVRLNDGDPVRPRAGIEKADIVYEDLEDATRTGLLAVYQSSDAEVVGPVGPIRPQDPLLVFPLHGLFGHVGGSIGFVRNMTAIGVTDLARSRAPAAYRRRAGREPPHDQYTSTDAMRELTPVDVRPPDPVFLFRPDNTPPAAPGATPFGRLIVRAGTVLTPSFNLDPPNQQWVLGDGDNPRLAEGNRQIRVENVVVQLVTYANGRPQLVGSGDVLVATGGQLVRGRWARDRPAVATRWVDSAGNDILFAPGRTWVVIVPVFSTIDTDPPGLVPAPS